jgi:hypothetical protein
MSTGPRKKRGILLLCIVSSFVSTTPHTRTTIQYYTTLYQAGSDGGDCFVRTSNGLATNLRGALGLSSSITTSAVVEAVNNRDGCRELIHLRLPLLLLQADDEVGILALRVVVRIPVGAIENLLGLLLILILILMLALVLILVLILIHRLKNMVVKRISTKPFISLCCVDNYYVFSTIYR